MKELIESTKRLQGDIDRCISRLVNARQYHDKIDEAGAVLDMERLLVASAQQLQCCVDKLDGTEGTIEWQTGEPKRNGSYLVTFQYCYCTDINTGNRLYETAIGETIWEGFWHNYHDERSDCKILAWCKLSNIKPYKEKEGEQ